MQQKQQSMQHPDSFVDRHLGPSQADVEAMLKAVGAKSLDDLIYSTIPSSIRVRQPLSFDRFKTVSGITDETWREGDSEAGILAHIRGLASQNQIYRSYLGMGYSDCITPPVIQRNILENPGWYTQYTPYQAEIAQGRLEALLNFQTLVTDLTAMQISNASLLDEATAAAEAMAMCFSTKNRDASRAFFVSELCHPQTIAVVKTRAESIGVEVIVGDHQKFDFSRKIFGTLVQYPATDGRIFEYAGFADKTHAADALLVVAADILSLTLLKAPGEFGADIAIGSTQRFGVPMGYGGPHAAYLATREEYKRQMPGRLVGLSKDADGKPAARLALQTREQHIRRDKATSNICTAQVLLAVVASMYAVYHGPDGLKKIASRVHRMAVTLARTLKSLGIDVDSAPFFDTVLVRLDATQLGAVLATANQKKINLRQMGSKGISIALDETVTESDLLDLIEAFGGARDSAALQKSFEKSDLGALAAFDRSSKYLTHPVFNRHHSEHEMLRYIHRLQSRDLSLTTSMIPLGSCTMKLNATVEMLPITWPEFGKIHPFVPLEQVRGYQQLITRLEGMLSEITGFDGVSLQPNAGSQGEYAGLLVIREYHRSRGQTGRDVCLIPQSAHGTNPASAALAGMRVVVVQCDAEGNIDVADLTAKAKEHAEHLAALMVTYPSTHGVFEDKIRDICEVVHGHGGQVYMDGANMNAQVGLCRPGDFGADVCHLNLHKTFCIPHGGGGPGMGPIGVREHLKPFLPGHPVVKCGGAKAIGPVSAAPWGSSSILPISYIYITLMGSEGLAKATQLAILNANYIARRLDPHFPVLYRGKHERVAHECIVDLRQLKATSGVEVEDVAKRLMDYGFHAPTVSFPVAGTMMIEPTESESKEEMDRFCDAMIAIREEIREIEQGKADRQNNVLKNAPHTAGQVTRTEWTRPYSREKAAYPAKWLHDHKFWPAVARIDNVYGDRNLFCSCAPMEDA